MTIVTCAIIEKEDKILIAQRVAAQKLAGKWEFPKVSSWNLVPGA